MRPSSGLLGALAYAASLSIGGCLQSPPDGIGKVSHLEWETPGSLEACVGDTIEAGVTKLVADSAKNRWAEVIKGYKGIRIEAKDAPFTRPGPMGRLVAIEAGSGLVEAVDTVDGLRSPVKALDVHECEAR